MTKYYIASGLGNVEQVRELKAYLDNLGWEHTYDWTVHGSVQTTNPDRLAEVAAAEAMGVLTADVLIALLPGGRGTHTELGMAVGQLVLAQELVPVFAALDADLTISRRLIVYSPNPEQDFGTTGGTCAFYHHPLVERASSWTELLRKLVS